MIDIRKIKNTRCLFCNEKAIKTINSLPFCAHCLDARLIRIIAACAKETKEVTIKFKIIPRSINGKESI